MLWCHNCNSKHGDDVKVCPECGGELSEEMPPAKAKPAKASWHFSFKRAKTSPEWPLDSSGNKVKPAFLANISGSQLDYEMAMGVRYGERDWKQQVEGLIESQRPQIEAVLKKISGTDIEKLLKEYHCI